MHSVPSTRPQAGEPRLSVPAANTGAKLAGSRAGAGAGTAIEAIKGQTGAFMERDLVKPGRKHRAWDIFDGTRWLATRKAASGRAAIAQLRREFARGEIVNLPATPLSASPALALY